MIIRCVMYAFAREMLQLEGSPRDEIVVVSGARMMHVAPSPPSPPPPPHFLLLRDGIGGRGKGEVLLPSFIGELGEGEGEGGRGQDLNAYIPSLIMFVCLFYPPRARYKWAVIPSRQVCFSWRRKQETNPSHASVAALSKKEDDRRFPRPLVTPPS